MGCRNDWILPAKQEQQNTIIVSLWVVVVSIRVTKKGNINRSWWMAIRAARDNTTSLNWYQLITATQTNSQTTKWVTWHCCMKRYSPNVCCMGSIEQILVGWIHIDMHCGNNTFPLEMRNNNNKKKNIHWILMRNKKYNQRTAKLMKHLNLCPSAGQS